MGEKLMRILLYDDDKCYCVLFRNSLSKNIEFDFATSRRTFFYKLKQKNYDVVFVDFFLGKQTALEVLDQWELQNESVAPVILLSSSFENLLFCQNHAPKPSSIIGYISKWEAPQKVVTYAQSQLKEKGILKFVPAA